MLFKIDREKFGKLNEIFNIDGVKSTKPHLLYKLTAWQDKLPAAEQPCCSSKNFNFHTSEYPSVLVTNLL